MPSILSRLEIPSGFSDGLPPTPCMRNKVFSLCLDPAAARGRGHVTVHDGPNGPWGTLHRQSVPPDRVASGERGGRRLAATRAAGTARCLGMSGFRKRAQANWSVCVLVNAVSHSVRLEICQIDLSFKPAAYATSGPFRLGRRGAVVLRLPLHGICPGVRSVTSSVRAPGDGSCRRPSDRRGWLALRANGSAVSFRVRACQSLSVPVILHSRAR